MTEQNTQNIQLKDNDDGEVADLKVSAQTAEKIIVQQSPSYQDRLFEKVADQVILNSAGAGLGIIVTVAGAVFAVKWLGLPEALKTFLENQKSTSEAISRLADGLKDLIREHEENTEDIRELKSDVRDIKDDVHELKVNVTKNPSNN